nr:basic proline-rich protein [Chlorocebus sabaeus]
MSQPDQQHKLLPQPGPWCRGGTGPRGGQQSGSGASPSFLAADVGPPSLLFLSLPRRAAPRPKTPPSTQRLGCSRRAPRATGIRGGAGARVLQPAFSTSATALKKSAGVLRGKPLPPLPEGSALPHRSKKGNGRQKRSQTPTGSGRPPRGSEQRSSASPASSCRHVPSCAVRAPPCSEPPVGAGLRPSRHPGPHPRRAAAPAVGPLSAPTIAGAHPAEAAAGSAKQQPRHSREVPRPPVPQHPSGKSRSVLQEAKTEQTKTP